MNCTGFMSEWFIDDLKKEYKSYMSEDKFLGIGTTRAVFKINQNIVLKVHLNKLGYLQSKKEYEIYNKMDCEKYKYMLSKQYYVCEEFSVCEYAEPMECYNDAADVWCRDNLPFVYDECDVDMLIDLLADEGIMIDDLSLSTNIGISKEGKLVFIDYGFTEDLYEMLVNLEEHIGEELFKKIRETHKYEFVDSYMKKVLEYNKLLILSN